MSFGQQYNFCCVELVIVVHSVCNSCMVVVAVGLGSTVSYCEYLAIVVRWCPLLQQPDSCNSITPLVQPAPVDLLWGTCQPSFGHAQHKTHVWVLRFTDCPIVLC